MPGTAEVNRFQAKVRGDKDFISGTRPKNGTVVANAYSDRRRQSCREFA
jgi:hypothetical protein